jgi:hypothetical protein
MDEVRSAEEIKALTKAFLDRGFAFEYTYQKGGDSSCVYVYRYRKGKDYFDWRETSGETAVHLMTYVNGVYNFPSIKTLFPKEYKTFFIKHLLKKASFDECRNFTADLLKKELLSGKADFLGIPL